jgi:ubiquinone/menaquinone biosynthesis C-methylase UbiE
LPFEDASFDALIAVQVIEYLDRPTEALSEMRRVSGASGRLTVLATNWSTMFWNCPVPELNDRIRVAWQHHAPHPDLPAELRPLLAGAGFRMSHQAPVTIINNAYHEDTFAYWAAQLISAFGVGRSLVSHTEAADWLAALQKAQSAGTFFFSSTAVLTTAVAV